MERNTPRGQRIPDDSADQRTAVSMVERERRLLETRTRLDNLGLDALIVYGNPLVPGGVTYLTGHSSSFEESWCIVTANQCTLVTGPYEDFATGGACWLEPRDIHRLERSDDQMRRVVGLLGSKIRRAGLSAAANLPAGTLASSLERLGSPAIQPTDLLSELRSIKSAEEVDLMRAACELVDVGAETFVQTIEPGISETELAGVVEGSMRTHGLAQLASPLQLGSGPRTLERFMLPTSRSVKAGELVLVDIGARSLGYCSDIARTAVAGNASEDQMNLLEIVRSMYDACRSMLRPGVDARAVYRQAVDVAASAGHEFVNELGHGIGCDVHEHPPIDEGRTELPLAAGMVVCIEPGLYVEGIGGARLENPFLIEADGPTPMTSTRSFPWLGLAENNGVD